MNWKWNWTFFILLYHSLVAQQRTTLKSTCKSGYFFILFILFLFYTQVWVHNCELHSDLLALWYSSCDLLHHIGYRLIFSWYWIFNYDNLPYFYLCCHLMVTWSSHKTPNHLITLLNIIFIKSQNEFPFFMHYNDA